jgi:hypothetical protein
MKEDVMYKLITLGLLTLPASAMNDALRIKKSALQVPSHLGNLSLIHENNNFFVEKNTIRKPIQKAFTSPMLRTIKPEQLVAFQECGGLLKLNQMSDGEYSLRDSGRINGGFLLTGCIVHQVSRVVGHASIWTAAGVVVVGGFVTGGPAGGSAAYLGAVAMLPSASAAVETGALALGVAASWIPGLP